MKKSLTLFIALLLFTAGPAFAADPLADLGDRVLTKGLAALKVDARDPGLGCLTNAGWVSWQGRDTAPVLDTLTRASSLGAGAGSLMSVHDNLGGDLWFAFVHKRGPRTLLLTLVTPTDSGVTATAPRNIHVDRGTSFDGFKKDLGRRTFAIVTLANGWADGVPADLLRGACFHDHFCCGVASGYFTARYIREHLPLTDGQRYTYLGVPAWCQDDYIIHALNLTPGKHGYVTMTYPWSRPWHANGHTYENLGGIVLRTADGKGEATVLSFDWRLDDFKRYLGAPELEINWRRDPWLHVCYNRFLFSGKSPEHVKALCTVPLDGREDVARLTRPGANPLAVLLGPDPAWPGN